MVIYLIITLIPSIDLSEYYIKDIKKILGILINAIKQDKNI